jgi:hypothetical protein
MVKGCIMKASVSIWLSTLLISGSVLASPPSVNPEAPDMDMEITAKILKEKSRRGGTIADGIKDGRDGSSSGGECGSININNNAPKSNSGIREMFGKQNTTIITGPVINMPNCK